MAKLTKAEPQPSGDYCTNDHSLPFGLTKSWLDAWQWADLTSAQNELLRYIDVLQMAATPFWLGTALHELKSAHASALYDQWQADDQSAAVLDRLSRSARQDPTIFSAYPPLTRGISGQSQLKGQIEENYLFAMVAEHLGTASGESRRWLITLRAWALTMGLRLEWSGNVRDRYLRQIAKGIRLACDRKPQWESLLASMTGPTDTVEGLTSFLGYRAYQLRKESRDFGGEQVKFLRAIIEIAEGRSAPEDSLHHNPSIAHQLNLPKPTWEVLGLDQPKPADDETPEILVPSWLAGGTDPGLITLAHVRPTDSYGQQQSSARSVHLLDAEGLHHLPWSWRKPNTYERAALSEWIDHLLSAETREDAVLGVLIWMAVRTGRTLYQVAQITVSADLAIEWTITPNLHELMRLPPQRGNGWKPGSDAAREWVADVAASIRIRIPPAVRIPMERLASSMDRVESLASWWNHPAPPASQFLRKRPHTLRRVTPGMLGLVLPQRVYEETGDGSMARLLASHPQAGLPGACAYANWSASLVTQHLNTATPIPVTDEVIGAGSHLSPLETPLRESIQQAGQALKQRMADGDWMGFHNAYVAYLTLSLLAATGARSIRDPFESRRHIDLDAAFVYIDDKSSGAARNGRLVPLPPLAVQQIRAYEGYLLRLSKRLNDRHNILAAAIREAVKGNPRASIPFLFMLSVEDGALTWESVSLSTIDDTGVFSCPLPLNLFRHRLAQQLRQRGLDPEIIDGLLGHAEFGCNTYGDDSTRTWAADMAVARPHLAAVHQALGFSAISPVPAHGLPDTLAEMRDSHSRLYGVRARAQAREQTHEAARAQARRIIERFLNGRDLTALEEDELWMLSKQLLLSETGMPLPTGYIRYAVLMDDLEQAWKTEGKRVRIGRRLMRLTPPSTLFNAEAPGANQWHQQVCETIMALRQGGYDRYSPDEQRLLAATALCVEARVSRVAVLHDVLRGLHYRVTVLNGQYDLEFQETLKHDDPDTVVERFPIPAWLAFLLAHTEISMPKAKNQESLLRHSSFGPLAPLRPFAMLEGEFKVTWGDYLARLANRMDQLNAMTLPGALAAWYAGRTTAASLGWRDRIRLHRGRPPVFDSDRQNDEMKSGDGGLSSVGLGKATIAIRTPDKALDVEALQRGSRAFFSQVRSLLTDGAGKEEGGLSTGRRRTLAAAIRRLIKDGNGKVSPATLQLTQWIAALVGSEIEGQRSLKRSTIERYFSALSPMFENFAYDSDLLAMDGEDLTELYADMLRSLTQKDTQYTADRLSVFHRWLMRIGADTPDWSEMPATVTTERRAPGVITEVEYQTALSLMMNDCRVSVPFRMTSAFLLLGCYRFGLRGGECLGLGRDDWVMPDDHTPYVLIQNHQWRQLKSKASRRQVPLLFVLTDIEKELISNIQARYDALHGHDQGFPLLGEDAQSKSLSNTHEIKRYVINTLKQVTGNPSMTLHHARHTAINRIARVLLNIDHEHWRDIGRVNDVDHDNPRMESVLMGTKGISRRQSWGLARYLGHAGTHTVWQSYLHIHPDWARQLLDIPSNMAHGNVPGLVDLSEIQLRAGIHGELLVSQSSALAPLDVQNALALMRLVALGKSPSAAAFSLGIKVSEAEDLTRAVEKVGQRLKLYYKDEVDKPCHKDSFEFLKRYPTQTWSRMMNWARTVDPVMFSKSPCETQAPELELLVEIVGGTGQLVMWKADHFATVRRLITLAQITDDQFHVWRTKQWHTNLETTANEFRFVVKDPSTYDGRIQIDSAAIMDPALSVSRRAALLFNERSEGVLRNRLELLLVLIAVATSLRFCGRR